MNAKKQKNQPHLYDYSLTFSAHYRGATETDCILCDAGNFCAERGLNKTSGQCAAGYFCPRGQSQQHPGIFLSMSIFYVFIDFN